jgi:glutamate synthase (NADPH/NADH) large chain
MQHACDTGSYESWKKYSSLVDGQSPINLRDLMDFKPTGAPVSLEDVESNHPYPPAAWYHPAFRLAR